MIPLTQTSQTSTMPQPLPNTLTPPSSPSTDVQSDRSKGSGTDQLSEDHEVGYWSCSEAGSSDTYYTCPEYQDLMALFEPSERDWDDEGMTLQELLQSRPSIRRKYRSRSLSPKRIRFRSRSVSRTTSRSRSEERRSTETLTPKLDSDEIHVSHEKLTRAASYPKTKKKGPQAHPDGLDRLKKSPPRATKLTKEIVESFVNFRNKVLDGSKSRSCSRSAPRTPEESTEDIPENQEDGLNVPNSPLTVGSDTQEQKAEKGKLVSQGSPIPEAVEELDDLLEAEYSKMRTENTDTALAENSKLEAPANVDSMSSGFEDMAPSPDSAAVKEPLLNYEFSKDSEPGTLGSVDKEDTLFGSAQESSKEDDVGIPESRGKSEDNAVDQNAMEDYSPEIIEEPQGQEAVGTEDPNRLNLGKLDDPDLLNGSIGSENIDRLERQYNFGGFEDIEGYREPFLELLQKLSIPDDYAGKIKDHTDSNRDELSTMSQTVANVEVPEEGRTSAASGAVSRASAATSTTTGNASTTTISTIAVQSGDTRIVLALLQSAEWLELRVVELHPGLAFLGGSLEEALSLQKAHQEVLTKLQGKQSPVEDLLNQADQLIATQRPKAEVYAAMAESLGLAWRDLNNHLETRKLLLDMSVSFHTKAQQYSDSMDAAEKSYTDNVMPSESEGVRKLLLCLQDHKRAILESSMFTLQEAKILLSKLRSLLQDGGSMDSRPQHIKTSIEFACSQIEHHLEMLHDRRKFLDGIFTARKHHLEQCLSLCLLYQDLTSAVLRLKELRDEISNNQDLGDSQANAEILLHEHHKRSSTAKIQQDQCVRLVKTAENMVENGHYAGSEPRTRAYSVLEAATALHETCDTRTALLEQTTLFFKLANSAVNKLDQAEVQVAALASGGMQRLSVVIGVVEEAVQPALTEGYAILEVTGGRGRAHNQGITRMVEQLENRRLQMNSICEKSTEMALQRTELVNSFLEQYNSIESWLIKIGDSFLQGHQDPGASLSLAKDFLHLHSTLSNDINDKRSNIEALVKFLSEIEKEIPEEDVENYKNKLAGLTDHWKLLRSTVDSRIRLSQKYVEFHLHAENLQNKFDNLESLLKSAASDDGSQIEEQWNDITKNYQSLQTLGKEFIELCESTDDPTLDINRGILCVQTILENFGKKKLVISDLHSHFQMKITASQELTALWKTYRDNLNKMNKEMLNVEEALCPLLRGDPDEPDAMGSSLDYRLGHFVSALKKIQEGIESMVTKAEGHAFKEDSGEERAEIVKSLLKLYQSLQNKVTDYQVLGTMLSQWCKNVAEIHKSCDKLENQYGLMSNDPAHLEHQMKENEASRQAVSELINFAQNESKGIVQKITTQCPPEAGKQDIKTMEKMLERRKQILDSTFSVKQLKLEKQHKRSQYQLDLQVISDQLRDLSEQLNRMKGHYGDCLPAAENMRDSFIQFKLTVDMLEKRIQNFVDTSEKMLLAEDDSGEIRIELAELGKKWGNFLQQVDQSQKNVDLSIDYFKLVQEAEDWFKKGSQLLVSVSDETSSITTPDQAVKLKQKIESFLNPGQDEQADRMKHIIMLANLLYGDAPPKLVENVTHQNQYIVDNFTVIDKNLSTLVDNMKKVQEEKAKQEEEQRQLAQSLATAQAEAEAAKLAAEEAEDARKQAEEAVRVMSPIQPQVMHEKVESTVQTESYTMTESVPVGSPPKFQTPLIGATVSEGVKFTFECRVEGDPRPDIHWLKDGLSIMNNPDYKTIFKDGVCSLTIEETFTEDSALFTCKASNEFGTAETSASLSVKEAPPAEPHSPPVFTRRLSNQSSTAGKPLQLECSVSGHPLPIVSWTKNNENIDNSSDYVITYNNGSCVLRFEELFSEDTAEYVCRASNHLGEDTTRCQVTVNNEPSAEKPEFVVPLSNVMARAGQKFKLECQVTGNPLPTVAWFHNGRPIKESPDCKMQFDGSKASLHITESFPKNGGIYSVVAKNAAGETQTSSNVSVKGRIPTETSDSEILSDADLEPVKPKIQLALKDTVVREGKSARLDCVIVGQPEPEVIWYHDDKPVKESEDFKLLFHGDRCSLVIQEVYEEDVGIYRVVAMNSAGEASTACFLNVEAAPDTSVAPRFIDILCDSHAVENDTVKLFVRVEGQPVPTVEWFRDGAPVDKNTTEVFNDEEGYASLDIPRATLDHTGQYEAIATNSAGTAKSAAFLSIEPYLPPKKVSPPTITKHLKPSNVQAGEPLTLEVQVQSEKKPVIQWNINDFKLTGTEYQNGVRQYFFDEKPDGVYQLHMPSVAKVQAGTVSFIAENPAGKAKSSASLDVYDSTEQPSSTDVQNQTKTIVSEQHTTKIVTSSIVDGEGETQKTFSSEQKAHISNVSGEPIKEVYESKVQQSVQEAGEPPVTAEKVNVVRLEDRKIIEERDYKEERVSTPPTPIKKVVRKSTPARFLTPLQGVIAKEDDPVELEGIIDGFPQPEVVWTHNGGPLPPNASGKVELNKVFLRIPKVSQDHSGRYTCSLDNEAGSAECTCDIVVKKTQFPPVFSKRLQPAVVGTGSRLHLEVDVSGTPTPTVEWSKNGQPLKSTDDLTIKAEGTRHWLVKQGVESADSGRYGVCASNAAGRSECLADVLVSDLVSQDTSTRRIIYTNVTDDARTGDITIKTEEKIDQAKVSDIQESVPATADKPIAIPLSQGAPIESHPVEEPVIEAVKKPPGKLHLSWPPPAPSDDEIEKINPLDDISRDIVSSHVNTFSEIVENEAIAAAASSFKPSGIGSSVRPTSGVLSTNQESENLEISKMDSSEQATTGPVLMEVKTEKHVKESNVSEVKTTVSSSEQTIVETRVYRDYMTSGDASHSQTTDQPVYYPPLITQIALPVESATSVTSSSETKMTSQQAQENVQEESAEPKTPMTEAEIKKKKRESVKQIAMRLEENIAPLTPEEVPCGVRIFPTPKAPEPPKQPPVVEDPKSEESFVPFPELKPFPFEVEQKPQTEKEQVPPPRMPKKFVPGGFTDSEYDSDFDLSAADRQKIRKVNFEMKIKEPQPIQSAQPAPPPPFDFGTPPVVEGMRPKIDLNPSKLPDFPVKKDVVTTPKKTPKIVEKFYAKSGVSSEAKIDVPATSIKEVNKPANVAPPTFIKSIQQHSTSQTIQKLIPDPEPVEYHPPVTSRVVPPSAAPTIPEPQFNNNVAINTQSSVTAQEIVPSLTHQTHEQQSVRTSQTVLRNTVKSTSQSNRVSWPQKTMKMETDLPPPTWIKTRTQSLERPKRTAPVMAPASKEAPPTIFWSSNISLTEKSKTPEVPVQTEQNTIKQVSLIQNMENTSTSKQFINPLSIPKPVKSVKPALKQAPLQKKQQVASMQQFKDDLNVQFKQIPQCEPFPFTVKESRPVVKSKVPLPCQPSRFIPGTFAETDYESDYEGRPPSFWRPYASDTESAEYRPLKMKMKQGRTRHQKQKSPPGPPRFERPLPMLNEWRPNIDYESDIPTSREHSPVRQVLSSLKTKVTYKDATHKPNVTATPSSKPRVATVPAANVYTGPPKEIIHTQQNSFIHQEKLPEPKLVPASPPVVMGKPAQATTAGKSNMFEGQRYSSEIVTAPKSFVQKQVSNIHSVNTSPLYSTVQTQSRSAPSSQMNVYNYQKKDLEESGYAADTESTLPRRNVKSGMTSSSFSKSESFVSSSSVKKETKSFQSSNSQFMGSDGVAIPNQIGGGSQSYSSSSVAHIPFDPSSSLPSYSQPVHQTSRSFMSSESKSSQMHTTRTEETKEEVINGKEFKNTSLPKHDKKPKFEEFRRETKGTPGGDSPYTEKQYYTMSDESEVITDSGKKKSKIFMKTESLQQVHSDKKSEYYSYSSKIPTSSQKKTYTTVGSQSYEKAKEPQKRSTSTCTDDLVQPHVISRSRETQTDSEMEDRSSVPSSPLLPRAELKSIGLVKKATGDFPRKSQSRPEPVLSKNLPPMRTEPIEKSPAIGKKGPQMKAEPTLPSAKPNYQNQVKVEFPDSETEPESKKYQSSTFEKSQPQTYGVESSKSIQMQDEGTHHRRFISMQQTTKVIKMSSMETQTNTGNAPNYGSYNLDNMPELKPFPFKPEPEKPRRKKVSPPPTPKKFYKTNLRESDYESDFDEKIKPKWKPADSDAEDKSYIPIKPSFPVSQKPRKHERTPTPPSVFDRPPPMGEPLRPTVDTFYSEPGYGSESDRVFESPIESSNLRPGTPPSEGFTKEKVDYVIGKVDLQHKVAPPQMKSVQTYIHKPYKEIIEKTEKKIIDKKVLESTNVKTSRLETTKTTVTPKLRPQHDVSDHHGTQTNTHWITTHKQHVDQPISQFQLPNETKKDSRKIQIDVDITDVYDYASESDHSKQPTQLYSSQTTVQSTFSPDGDRPKRERGGPLPTPTKFLKGSLRESDYESDFDGRIQPKWMPTDSESEANIYRKVAPPKTVVKEQVLLQKEPPPPSKFDHPPQFDGPPRPHVDLNGIPKRERRESLEEYSVVKFPTVEFKPFEMDEPMDDKSQTTVTYSLPVSTQDFSKVTQDYVGKQFSGLSDAFKTKAQHMADNLATEVFDSKPNGVPETTSDTKSPLDGAQSYRDQSRASEFGTRHIDPDTGLIYFKYDFGYEFGLVLPGKGKPKSEIESAPEDQGVDIPVAHYYSDDETRSRIRKEASNAKTSRKSRKGPPIPKMKAPYKVPMFIMSLRDLSVSSGGQVLLECVVQAESPLTVCWYKDGYPIQENHRTHLSYQNGVCRLSIDQITDDDGGVYSCKVKNTNGEKISRSTVFITPGMK